MSESPIEQAFKRRFEEELQALRQDGWKPLSADELRQLNLPKGAKPDFIFRKNSEILVGQIKSRNSHDLQDLETLARVVSKVPNARMELYWLGDEPEFYPNKDLLRQYTQDSSALLAMGQTRAAVVTAWSALEGALLHYAAESRAPLPGGEPLAPKQAWPLVSQLYSIGYITDDDYECFRQLYRQRNTVAHFIGNEPPDPSNVEYVLNVIGRMLDRQYLAGRETENAAGAIAAAEAARRLAFRQGNLFPSVAISAILERCITLAEGIAHPDPEHLVNANRAHGIARSIGQIPGFAFDRRSWNLERAQERASLLALEASRGEPGALTSALELARDVARNIELSIATGGVQDVVGQLPIALSRSIVSSLDLACEFARDHTFRSSLDRELSLVLGRSAELTSILSEAMSRELGIEPVEGLASALLDHALDDFTDADLSDADLSSADLQGLRWSDRTEWPSELDIDDLRSRSVENPPGSGIYMVARTPGSQDDSDQVRVHAVYLGVRVEGIYHPSTQLIDIVSGPVPHTSGLKPSPAAGEVIRALNEAEGKKVTGSRNGWEFWVVTATGQLLQSERPRAPQDSF